MDAATLTSSIVPPLAAAAIGSLATREGTRSLWYRRLDKPPFQPPALAFPVAWTALYTATAAGAVVAQSEMDDAARRALRVRLGVNMALNAGWCWSFFRGRRLGASVVVAGALALSSADLAVAAGRHSRRGGALLAPYAGWTTFATVLTGAIWQRNR